MLPKKMGISKIRCIANMSQSAKEARLGSAVAEPHDPVVSSPTEIG